MNVARTLLAFVNVHWYPVLPLDISRPKGYKILAIGHSIFLWELIASVHVDACSTGQHEHHHGLGYSGVASMRVVVSAGSLVQHC